VKYEKSFKTKKYNNFIFSFLAILFASITFFVCSSPVYAKYLSSSSSGNSSLDFYFNNYTITNSDNSGTVLYTRSGDRNLMSQPSVVLCIDNTSSYDYDIEVETLLKYYIDADIPEEKAIYIGAYLIDNAGNQVLLGTKKLVKYEYQWQVPFYYCGPNSLAIDGGTTSPEPFVISNNGSALISSGEYQNIIIQYLQKNSDNSFSIYSYTDIYDNGNMAMRTVKVYAKIHA